MRNKLYDYFELAHRFPGWTSLTLVWVQVAFFINNGRGLGERLPHACQLDTEELAYGLSNRGIPAYAPLFDS